MKRPNVKDYDLKPYGYIKDLTDYVDFLESKVQLQTQTDKKLLSDVMFSIFSPDEIQTIIKHREFRGMKTLQMSKQEQDEFREIINKIEDMFDV